MFKFNNGIGAVVCNKCHTIIQNNVDPRKYKQMSNGIDLCPNCHIDDVDNFDKILEFMDFKNQDEFYFLQVIQRKKDGNVTQIGNNGYRTIKTYYIYSKEQLENKRDKIKELCVSNNARAYIHPNKRNAKKVALSCIQHYAQLISEGNACQGYRVYDSCCGKNRDTAYKPLWIIDVDTKDSHFIQEVIDYINECQGAEDNKIKTIIPTVNGVHLITIGFNVQQFKTKLEEAGIEPIDIQKDNPTLLYYAKPE